MHLARLTVNYQFLRLKEAAADGENSRGSDAPPWERAVTLQLLYQALLLLGRLDDAAKIRDELEPLATRIGQSYTVSRCLILRAWVDFGTTPELERIESVLKQVLKSDPKVPAVFWDLFSQVQLSLVDFLGGDWASAAQHARASCELEAQTSRRGMGVGTFFRQMAYAGDREGALAILHEKREWLPRSGQTNTMGSWWMLALVIEGLVILGENSRAGQLYPLARELVDTGAVVLWPIFRFPQTIAGMAAAAAHQWEAAEDHFRNALQNAESIPLRLEQAEIRRFHAMMMMDRDAPGDREKARTLLGKALETYTKIGMPRHVEMTQTLLG